jgi:hypothetical protein
VYVCGFNRNHILEQKSGKSRKQDLFLFVQKYKYIIKRDHLFSAAAVMSADSSRINAAVKHDL